MSKLEIEMSKLDLAKMVCDLLKEKGIIARHSETDTAQRLSITLDVPDRHKNHLEQHFEVLDVGNHIPARRIMRVA